MNGRPNRGNEPPFSNWTVLKQQKESVALTFGTYFYCHVRIEFISSKRLRPVYKRELAPETRSRVSTPTSTHGGACS